MSDFYVSSGQLDKLEDLVMQITANSSNCDEKECIQANLEIDNIVDKLHDVIAQIRKQPA